MPKISVIVPIYNVEKYIKDCLESILNQTFSDFEVLCVDDCGTDKSMEIVKSYAKKDNRIRILYHNVNKGLSEARNTAIKNAIGDYVICIDSDDWVENTQFEKIYLAFEETNAESIWYNANMCTEESDKMHKLYSDGFFQFEKGFIYLNEQNLNKFADYAWNKAYKLNTINQLGLKYPKDLFFEDASFYIKAFTQINTAYYINEPLYNYRIRKNSIVTGTNNTEEKIKHLFYIIEDIYNYMIEKNLFEKYKRILLELISSRIYSVLIPNHRETAVRTVLNTLNKIGFPDKYLDLRKEISNSIYNKHLT